MNDPSAAVGMTQQQAPAPPASQQQQQQQQTAWTISTSVNPPTLSGLALVNSASQHYHAPTPTSDRAPFSIYERVRHFLYINLLLNKYSFILSILSYVAQLFLFIALSLYLFSNVSYLYEFTCVSLPPTPPFLNASSISPLAANSTQSKFSSSIKQSYLSLQIITLFVFFICFILAALIRLQFKYHRLALNLYDYDPEQGRNAHRFGGASTAIATTAFNLNDHDGGDSLASTTTGSHFSSSMSKRLTTLVKRLFHRLLTKIASILLYLTLGYHFCQNCFIESSANTKLATDSFTIFMHVLIAIAVLFRSVIVVLEKRHSMNKLDYVKSLQRKQQQQHLLMSESSGGLLGLRNQQQTAVDEIELAPSRTGLPPSAPPRTKHYDPQNYYSYYYTYLIKYNQSAFNQLKQHQQNQTRFRVLHLNDVSLLVGFALALFHLFSPGQAVQLFFVLSPVFFSLVLFRLKSVLNAFLGLVTMFVVLFYLSSAALAANRGFSLPSTNLSSIVEKTFPDSNCGGNDSTVRDFQTATNVLHVNIYGLNLLTFVSFLVTLYLKSALSIYYCTLTSLERWNIAFLSTMHSAWRQLAIWSSLVVYCSFALACGLALLLGLIGSWRVFVFFPLYVALALLWCAFQLLNTVNLLHLMNKIADCFLLLNESSSAANGGAENASNVSSRKSKSNRHSTLSQQSQSNHNLSSGSVSASTNNNKPTSCSLRKLLSRFLSYHKLNVSGDESSHAHFNIPIHRILNYKGVRHLGSISYRISLYCMALTFLLAPFAFLSFVSLAHPITLGLYVSTIAISLVFLSLLYQFPASQTGSCLAYACVSPPLAFNIYQNQTMSSNTGGGGGGGSTTMSSNSTGHSKTTTNSSKSRTTSSGLSVPGIGTGTGTASSAFIPFNYQQALQHRCAYILQRMQAFLQFQLIDNFGCDLAPANGFRKSALESKLAAFFRKRPPPSDSSHAPNAFYNTYLLYYCGPTSPLTDSLAFVDGSELSIEEIISLWKQVHCGNSEQIQTSSDEETTEPQLRRDKNSASSSQMTSKSRLIIVLDAENTSKSLEYVRSKCRESNVYVALQTAKYNYLGASKAAVGKSSLSKHGIDNRLLSGGGLKRASKKLIQGPPGSPQTLTAGTTQSFFDSYLNMGKFTLDWIKSNSNAASGGALSSSSYDAATGLAGFGIFGETDAAHSDPYFIKSRDFDEHAQLHEDDEDEEDEDPEDDSDDDDDSSQDSDEAVTTTAAENTAVIVENPEQNRTLLKTGSQVEQAKKSQKKSAPLPPTSQSSSHQSASLHASHQPQEPSTVSASSASGSFFYEAKCAFSHYWLDFTFDSAEVADDSSVASELTQFWNIYYPCRVCRPILAMINCPLFYLKLEPLRKLLLWARRFKARILPVHEFETGHGFKLFSS